MTIKVYSTPSCGFCVRLKEYLKEKNVEFEAIDLAEHPDLASYIINLTSQTGVPVLVKEEEGRSPEFIVGFDRSKVDAMLGL